MASINTNLLWLIAGTFATLLAGTLIRLIAIRNSTADVIASRLGSLKVWWILATLWSLAVIVGQTGAAILLGLASFLGMKEFLRLIGTPPAMSRLTLAGLIFSGSVHYILIIVGQSKHTFAFFPMASLLLLGSLRLISGNTNSYIRTSAGVYLGVMLLIYGLSHALLLFEIIFLPDPVIGPAGWFLFVVLLTEMNDIMQAIVGRKFGKRKITPRISPNKSLEGLLGGLLTSIALAISLAPWLTTLMLDRSMMAGLLLSALAGIVISLTGFLGDINMSAIKRDAGVKDGSSLLPGMGGVIDRVDSLTFTAPAFYYFVVAIHQYTN